MCGGIIGHMQGSRTECALARSVRKLIVLYFYYFPYALRRSQ